MATVRLFHCIILITIAYYIETKMILFPVSDHIDWISLEPSQIICDNPSYSQELSSGIKIKGVSPHLHKNYKLKGFLCEKMELITTCNKGFFGGTTIKRKENYPDITKHDCQVSLNEAENKISDYYEHPTPVCSWMKENDNARTITVIKDYDIIFDPYSNKLISPLFVGGYCVESPCKTIFTNKIWISDVNNPPDCISEYLNNIVIFLNNPTNFTDYKIWSPDTYVSDFHSICTMNYCNKNGFLFPNGEWIGIDKSDIPHITSLGEFLYNVPTCNKSARLFLKEENSMVHEAETTDLDALLRFECEKTRELLLLSQPINRVQLQSLSPRIPGVHPVYRLMNNTIQTGFSNYRWLYFNYSSFFPYVSFYTYSGEEIKWSYWNQDKKLNILEGPNGIVIKNKKLIYSLLNTDSFIRDKKISSSIHYIVPEPSVTSIHISVKRPSSSGTYQEDDASVTDILPHIEISRIFYHMVWILSLLSVFIYLVKCCINRGCHVGRQPLDLDRNSLQVFYKP